MGKEIQIEQIRLEFSEIKEVLSERSIRRWCAAKSRAYDRAYKRGGVTVVSEATGISRPCIYRGIKEIEQCLGVANGRLRQQGGGRKKNR
jgi:hypothetical protein